MARACDTRDGPTLVSGARSTGSDAALEPGDTGRRAARVLVVDADNLLFGLIEEWLGAAGHHVTTEPSGDDSANGRADLIVVDIPFPRQGCLDLLRRVAAEHPGTPILALSSTFFAGIGSNGAVARALGVAGVLPKPLKREALVAAVGDLLTPSR